MSTGEASALMVVLADDLSGAADAATACMLAGHATMVLLDGHPGGQLPRSFPHDLAGKVVAIDADTRGLSAEDAATVTGRLARRYLLAGRPAFRKLDSTLRGHVAVELRAILDAVRETGPSAILLAAAFPAMGRTTRNGSALLHGVPLEQTEIWRHERRVGPASIVAILAAAGLRTAVVGIDALRGSGLAARFEALVATGIDVIACDAVSDRDLERIAVAARSVDARLVWAGSAGLARHLPCLLPSPRPVAAVPVPAITGPILFVVGSLSTVSSRQVAMLVDPEPAAIIEIDADQPDHHPDAATDPAGPGARLAASLAAGRDTVLTTRRDPDADPAGGRPVARALGRLVAPEIDRIGAIVATGGETARAVLTGLGVDAFHLLGEIETGVPLGLMRLRAAGGTRDVPVVTKAGAFGDDRTLLRVRDVLRNRSIPYQATGQSR